MKPAGRSFWGWWLLACTVGLAVTMYGFAILGGVLTPVLGVYVSAAVIAIMNGLLLGVLQWLVLRQHLNSGWWVLSCALGWGAILLFGVIANNVLLIGRPLILYWVAWASVPGMLQWLVLRGQVARAGWWIFASMVGVGVGLVCSGVVLHLFVNNIVRSVGIAGVEVTHGAVFGAVYGAITGFALTRLLGSRLPPTSLEV